jgi:hypothetical protein
MPVDAIRIWSASTGIVPFVEPVVVVVWAVVVVTIMVSFGCSYAECERVNHLYVAIYYATPTCNTRGWSTPKKHHPHHPRQKIGSVRTRNVVVVGCMLHFVVDGFAHVLLFFSNVRSVLCRSLRRFLHVSTANGGS